MTTLAALFLALLACGAAIRLILNARSPRLRSQVEEWVSPKVPTRIDMLMYEVAHLGFEGVLVLLFVVLISFALMFVLLRGLLEMLM